MGRFNTGIPGLSFSWKRALGISRLKYRIGRATGIPTTSTGRNQKLGKYAGRILLLAAFLFILALVAGH